MVVPFRLGTLKLTIMEKKYHVARYIRRIHDFICYDDGTFDDFESAWAFFLSKVKEDNNRLESPVDNLVAREGVISILETAAETSRLKELIICVDDALNILRKD